MSGRYRCKAGYTVVMVDSRGRSPKADSGRLQRLANTTVCHRRKYGATIDWTLNLLQQLFRLHSDSLFSTNTTYIDLRIPTTATMRSLPLLQLLLGAVCLPVLPLSASASAAFHSLRWNYRQLPPTRIFAATKVNNNIPFIIERLPARPANDKIFDDVADMCIEVFFNDNNSKVPWKSLQLAYLRSLQSSDLRYRHLQANQPHCMVVARRVVSPSTSDSSSSSNSKSQPLIVDFSQVYHLPAPEEDWVRGEILGFCEVTERTFGIANLRSSKSLRPVLTNLSVRADVRQAGIGSKLVDACEDAVLEWNNNYKEVILEVEEDNKKAFQFYKQRGYQVMFEDPACRRYNTNGIWLVKEQCTKICMGKDLSAKVTKKESEASNKFHEFSKIFHSIRESVLGVYRS